NPLEPNHPLSLTINKFNIRTLIIILSMKRQCIYFLVLLLLAVQSPAQKFISVKGKEIIGLDGKPFLIKGINLGNWLVPEGYMFKFK
ncbi:hypothetical protein ABTE05_20155, partial [Acinetobacter baumannii]